MEGGGRDPKVSHGICKEWYGHTSYGGVKEGRKEGRKRRLIGGKELLKRLFSLTLTKGTICNETHLTELRIGRFASVY